MRTQLSPLTQPFSSPMISTAGPTLEPDALLFRVVDFLGAERAFVVSPAVDDRRPGCAHPVGGTGGVHGDVAAADHRHPARRSTGVSIGS